MKYGTISKPVATLAATLLLAFSTEATAAEPTESADHNRGPSWLSVTGILGVSSNPSIFEDKQTNTNVDAPALAPATRWTVTYILMPKATVGEFDFSLGLTLEQWMSDAPDDEASFYLGETLLNARWQGYAIEEIGLDFSPALTLVLPTSDLNDLAGLWFAAEAGLDIRQRLFDRLSIAANVSWRQNVHDEEHVVLTEEDYDIAGNRVVPMTGSTISHPLSPTFYRGGASLSRPEFDGWTAQVSSSLHLGLGIDARLPAGFSVGVGYSLHSYYPSDSVEDGYTSPYAGSEPEPKRLGVGTVDVRYSALDWLTFGLGTATTQPPEGLDGEQNFPFWNSDDRLGLVSMFRFYAMGRY